MATFLRCTAPSDDESAHEPKVCCAKCATELLMAGVDKVRAAEERLKDYDRLLGEVETLRMVVARLLPQGTR